MPFVVQWMLFVGLASVTHLYTLYLLYNHVETHDVKQTDKNDTYPMLCYFAMVKSWPNNGSLHPALNATLCTHILFISSGLKDNEIVFTHPDDYDKYISKIPLLRKQNPKVKVMISNGFGFSPVLASAENRTKFAHNAIPFLKKYGLDGLDIDWEFPGWPPYPKEQRPNFTMLLQELRDVFDKEAAAGGPSYVLSAAVAAGRSIMEIYNVTALAKSLDFINLMCYDFHYYRPPDIVTDYNSPLYPNDWWHRIVLLAGNVGWSSYEWNKRGMPKSKIMVGIPTYTHTWTLEQPERYHGLHAPATGRGKGCDECSYAWVCDFIKSGATVVWDEDAAVPYMYKEDQWVSFDNEKSLRLKTRWIVENAFGGVMVYCMNTDDYIAHCGQGKFPLITAIQDEIRLSEQTRRISFLDSDAI